MTIWQTAWRGWLAAGVAALGLGAGAVCAQTGTGSAGGIAQVVAFGDSTIDSGNSLAYFTARGTPYPVRPYLPGRFSNGPTWLDKLVANLGLGLVSSARGGHNYAVGGATTGPWGTLGQVSTYLGRVARADARTLHVIQTGENDIEAAVAYYATSGDLAGTLAQVDAGLSQLSQVLTRLRGAGAAQFLVGNVPDLGRQPGWEKTPHRALIRTLAQRWNQGVKRQLDILATQSGVTQVVRLDAWAMMEWAQLPSNHSFDAKSGACLVNGVVCADPHQHIFWDDHHLTTRYHNKLAVQVNAAVRR